LANGTAGVAEICGPGGGLGGGTWAFTFTVERVICGSGDWPGTQLGGPAGGCGCGCGTITVSPCGGWA
jgi:hypothetical protein